MSTRTLHQRSPHRSRFRRLALPAAVFGLTLAAQCSSLLETTFQSIARAEGPSLTSRKVEPRIVDFTKLAKLKAEARKGGMLYMQEEGLRLVVKGITSIDELLRVVK